MGLKRIVEVSRKFESAWEEDESPASLGEACSPSSSPLTGVLRAYG